jgi:hypothetical protein
VLDAKTSGGKPPETTARAPLALVSHETIDLMRIHAQAVTAGSHSRRLQNLDIVPALGAVASATGALEPRHACDRVKHYMSNSSRPCCSDLQPQH